MKVLIVHPDLGIGGAERLIVDAAVALKEGGNDVIIYTSHHDTNHCFPETKSKGEERKSHLKSFSFYFRFRLEFKVVVCGDWLPRSIFGSFYLLFAALRSIYLALYLLLLHPEGNDCDLILADQITFHLPILRLCSRSGVLFYCHFPDKFLAPKSKEFLRKGVYRAVLDWAEERCLALGAKEIVVNSQFTKTKFKEAFQSIEKDPEVLYPGVHIDAKEQDSVTESKYKFLLSLNRFERKKDLHLAIEAFKLGTQTTETKLIMAGGYDERVLENREHLKELKGLCDREGLKHSTLFRKDYSDISKIDLSSIQVLFLPSIPQETKQALLQQGSGLLYTPSHEHFGIVPIEAMAQGLPVIAMDSGGPRETVLDGITGYLCEADPKDIAEAIKKLFLFDDAKDLLGSAGRKRVNELFSLKVFGDKLNNIARSLQILKQKYQ